MDVQNRKASRSPRSSTNEVSAGVGAYGMSASISHTVGQRCETWDMTKGAVNDVNYALEWRGQVAADRGLGFVYTTRTPAAESGAANFIITYGVGGCVVIHC